MATRSGSRPKKKKTKEKVARNGHGEGSIARTGMKELPRKKKKNVSIAGKIKFA